MSASVPSIVSIGDLLFASGERDVPLGEVEATLPTSRGTQLVVKRAYSPGVYLVARAEEIEASEFDPALGISWHQVRGTPECVRGRGQFRRVMGRLTPDPCPAASLPPVDDDLAAETIARALANEPLIGSESREVQVRVYRGAASLKGWVRLVGAKVMAEQLARSAPGVWYVRNRLFSDEELKSHVERWLRAQTELAQHVQEVRLNLGNATITLSRPPSGDLAAAIQALRREPGIRDVELTHNAGQVA